MLWATTASGEAPSSTRPGGPIRTSRGSPSASARKASRTTIGSEQAPPGYAVTVRRGADEQRYLDVSPEAAYARAVLDGLSRPSP